MGQGLGIPSGKESECEGANESGPPDNSEKKLLDSEPIVSFPTSSPEQSPLAKICRWIFKTVRTEKKYKKNSKTVRTGEEM